MYLIAKYWSLELIEQFIKDLEGSKQIIQDKINGAQKARGEAIDKLAEENFPK